MCKNHTESSAQCDLDVYTDRQNYKYIQYSHIQYTQHRCAFATLRLALKPSCLKSRVGLIGSYLVSIELCACLQYTEQNSHSRPKSFSLCEYERKTRGRRCKADMKTTMWSWFTSAEAQTPHRGCDYVIKAILLCVRVQVSRLL